MKLKTIDRPFKVKAVKDDGTFTGYGSVFGEIDSYRDVVVKGAFEESLKEFESLGRLVPMLWQHDTRSPIGVYTSLKEDDVGLLVEGQCNMEVQKGRECHALMKQGALTGLSIGYNTEEDAWDEQYTLRRLLKLKLWEISPVTFPAGDSARVSGVKEIELITSLSECEDILRDAGFSRTEAKGFIARVKAVSTQREAADEEKAVIASVLSILRNKS